MSRKQRPSRVVFHWLGINALLILAVALSAVSVVASSHVTGTVTYDGGTLVTSGQVSISTDRGTGAIADLSNGTYRVRADVRASSCNSTTITVIGRQHPTDEGRSTEVDVYRYRFDVQVLS